MLSRKTKIIATIGPSSVDKNIIKAMISEGMDVIRINSAYGDIKQYQEIINNLSEVDVNNKVKKLLDIKGLEILKFCETTEFDFIAISFTETQDQVLKVKSILPKSFVISKIESVEGVRNYIKILAVSDGIMIARGDLGRATSIEKVPPLQKKFTKIALDNNKFVIAATEMLLSMTTNIVPTNAEVSDVANAVFDGVHAVMLSEETAIGKYPVESVAFMRRAVEEAEKWCTTNECTV
ncbi:MAG: pyruvate kinase [Patescibacteria group bacterium]